MGHPTPQVKEWGKKAENWIDGEREAGESHKGKIVTGSIDRRGKKAKSFTVTT